MRTDPVLDALGQALYDRCDNATVGLVNHSDRGTQHLSSSPPPSATTRDETQTA